MTINSANAEEWGDIARPLAADEVDVLLVSPERLNNPRFREEQLPEPRRPRRPARHRRGALRLRLGPRLPSRLPPASATCSASSRPTRRSRHHRHRQRPGRRRRRGAAGRRRGPHPARPARPRQPAARRAPAAHRAAAARLAGVPPRRTAGQRHHLHPHRAAADDIAALLREAGHAVALLHRPHRRRRTPRRPRRRCAHNKVKALVATSRARDGVRQARPRLRRPRRRARVADRLLPAGRPGRPRHRARRRPAPAGHRGRRHLALLRDRVDAATGARRRRPRRARRGRAAAVDGRARGGRRRPAYPARTAAQGARRRRRGAPGVAVAGRRPAAVDLRRGALRTGGGGPRRREPAMLDYEASEGCRMAYLQRVLDDPTLPPDTAPGSDGADAACGRCDRCAGPWYSTDVSARAEQVASGQLARVGVADRAARDVAERHGPARCRRTRSHRRRRAGGVRPGRRPAHRPRVGPAASRGARPGRRRRAGPRPLLDACVDVLRTLGVGAPARPASSRWRRGDDRQLVRSVAEGLAEDRPAAAARRGDPVDGGPTGEPGGNSAFRLAGVWDRLEVGDDVRAGLAASRRGHRRRRRTGDPAGRRSVDSRWTLTVAARALRLAGAGEVLPFALAVAG